MAPSEKGKKSYPSRERQARGLKLTEVAGFGA
jgi:hypothetical protein